MDKHPLQNICEEIANVMANEVAISVLSYHPYDIYEYRKSCLGVVIRNGEIGRFVGAVMRKLAKNINADYDREADVAVAEACAEAFENMQVDQVGSRTVVYFSKYDFVGDAEDNEVSVQVSADQG